MMTFGHRLMMAVVIGMSAMPATLRAAPQTSVTAAGVTLRSVSFDLPTDGQTFGEGKDAKVINTNCLGCHSAAMVLTQPKLSPAAWQGEVDKMRSQFKAPVEAADVPAIVAYLVNLPAGDAAPVFIGASHSDDPPR
jgi:hypothetical protein